jgi:hypothetical protein
MADRDTPTGASSHEHRWSRRPITMLDGSASDRVCDICGERTWLDLDDRMSTSEANGPGDASTSRGLTQEVSAPMPDQPNSEHPRFVKLARTMARWKLARLVEYAFSGSRDEQAAAQTVLRERGVRTHDHNGDLLLREDVEDNARVVLAVRARDARASS